MLDNLLALTGDVLSERLYYLVLANLLFVVGFFAYRMYYSKLPKSHADFNWKRMMLKPERNKRKRLNIWAAILLSTVLAGLAAYLSSDPEVSISKMIFLYYFCVCTVIPAYWLWNRNGSFSDLGITLKNWKSLPTGAGAMIVIILAELFAIGVLFSGISFSLTEAIAQKEIILASVLFGIFINSFPEEVFW